MQYGVVFPQIECAHGLQPIKDYAQTAEGLGYDYLLVYDHLQGAHPKWEPKLMGPYASPLDIALGGIGSGQRSQTCCMSTRAMAIGVIRGVYLSA
jgi:alkanesulfonate monooxygenase SsuD/methylene tetrahydromethanopterin reductase-like flavin-dependent oxidoreductase (luciferase family)